MKARRIAVLALIALVLPLGVARATTSGCTPATDLFGCVVSGSGLSGLQVWNSADGPATVAIFGSSNGGVGVVGAGGGIGVHGISNSGTLGGTGVFAESGGSGTGLLAQSTLGYAIVAHGSTQQGRSDGGWVKALVRMAGSTLSRCYNSQTSTPSTAATCNSFSITGASGNYTITFPFQVNDRYLVVTAESVADTPRCCIIQYDFPANNQVRVRTWDHNGAAIDRAFSLVVF
jgi:hypothetical protein